jgi:hypothetical protein
MNDAELLIARLKEALGADDIVAHPMTHDHFDTAIVVRWGDSLVSYYTTKAAINEGLAMLPGFVDSFIRLKPSIIKGDETK